MYYILSLKWSVGDLFVWWQSNNSGYTSNLEKAGKYSREQVGEKPDYYDNGKDTLAVPCELVEKEAVRVVLNNGSTIEKWKIEKKCLEVKVIEKFDITHVSFNSDGSVGIGGKIKKTFNA